MARSILTWTLLAALLALPAAAADPAADSASSSLDLADAAGLAPAGLGAPTVAGVTAAVPVDTSLVEATAEAALDQVAAAVDDAQELLCPRAVRLDLTWYGARVTDERERSGDFLMPYTVLDKALRTVPVYETVEETVTVSTLFGLLEPVTREVTRVVGYELRETVVPRTIDLAVALDWRESYLEWGTYRETVLLTLPAGLPFLGEGGELVSACDPEAPILSRVPDPHADGVSVWCASCTEQPDDGWVAHILDMDVRLAAPGETGTPLAEGWIVAPADLFARAQAKADALGVTGDDLPPTGDAGAAAEPLPPIGTASAGAVRVPASTAGALAALALAGLAGLAVGGRAVLRRSRQA